MNELRHATSPYLRQHADNPVDWQQWTPETLAAAKAAGKPILLSIGYAACHWCHVMAHESFEDPVTAEVMNRLFVNIKVDREERPDIDHIYMSALHALGQQGGWPLTMFLTPEGEPFWGGTYFPNTPRYGQPAFVQVLTSVERAFRADPTRIANNTSAILAHLRERDGGEGAGQVLPDQDDLAARIVPHIDPVHGGMTGAPKFPNPQILEFLWRAADRSAVPDCRARVIKTLERMSQGGIYDHLGGGFARYAVDERWLVPHFEKMLYDNAQLLELLTLAAVSRETPAPLRDLFRDRAKETVEWLLREMRGADGGFCASLDADSEGVEGKFYVWTLDQIRDVLCDETEFFARFYDVTPDGNWAEPHGPRVTILNRLETPTPNAEEARRLAALRERLLAARASRVRPGRDDKILADWNGLMIAALVRAGLALDEPTWIDEAAKAYETILDTMARPEKDGLRLAHSRLESSRVEPAFALDYAAMARAALALAEAFGAAAPRAYVDDGRRFLTSLLAHHLDGGRLAMAADDAGDVILRLKPTQDDAIPNAHPMAVDAMIRLAVLSGETYWQEQADRLIAGAAEAVQHNSVGHTGLLNAVDLMRRHRQIVVAGPAREALRRVALASSWLTRTVVDLADPSALPQDHPARAQSEQAAERAAAFICVGTACQLPAFDATDLAARLAPAEGL